MSTSTTSTVVLAGGAGDLGARIAAALTARGALVRALVRPDAPAVDRDRLTALGASPTPADPTDVDALASALADATVVVSALNGLREVIVDRQGLLLDAAVRAGVPRFISSDFSSDFTRTVPGRNRNFDLRREFMARADQTPIRVTSILNGVFTDMLGAEMPIIQPRIRRVLYWGSPDQPVDFTTKDDVAAYTAARRARPDHPARPADRRGHRQRPRHRRGRDGGQRADLPPAAGRRAGDLGRPGPPGATGRPAAGGGLPGLAGHAVHAGRLQRPLPPATLSTTTATRACAGHRCARRSRTPCSPAAPTREQGTADQRHRGRGVGDHLRPVTHTPRASRMRSSAAAATPGSRSGSRWTMIGPRRAPRRFPGRQLRAPPPEVMEGDGRTCSVRTAPGPPSRPVTSPLSSRGGETMGLLDQHGGAWEPSDLAPGLGALVEALDEAGASAHRFNQLASGRAADQIDQARLLEALMEVTESNAFPESEWAPLRHHLGDDPLAEVIGVSEASLRRYAAGSRRTPDLVGERLHWLALVVADLRGAYTDRGVRRWFRRPRTALGGASPAQVLREGLDPDSPRAAEVRALAHAPVAPGAV